MMVRAASSTSSGLGLTYFLLIVALLGSSNISAALSAKDFAFAAKTK
jgi:hypothetical protein